MSGNVLNWAARMPAGNAMAKLVLVVLAEAANDKGETFIGQDTVAERAEISRETVNRAMKRLQASGLISRAHRRRDDGYRTSDMIRLTLCDGKSCDGKSCDENAHKNATSCDFQSVSYV